MTSWFENFLKSFEHCHAKRISEKQFNVFVNNLKKYVYKESDNFNTLTTEYHFDGLVIITQDSVAGYGKGWHEYYLTIKNNK